MPNVGKSTLFNALLKKQAALAANYPFATIEPNVGVVPVPDERLDMLAETVQQTEKMPAPPPIKPATVEFVDIAGLVAGAHKGEGLGNQFLHHIRETQIICHVLRAFEDENIIREGSISPVEDLSTIRTELQLADLATLEKQVEPKGRAEKELKDRWVLVEAFKQRLGDGRSALSLILEQGTTDSTNPYHNLALELSLLTAKPELIVLNVGEPQLAAGVEVIQKQAAQELDLPISQVLVMSNQLESDLAGLSAEDQKTYLQELGLAESGLARLIKLAYQNLKLQSFLTAGIKEVKAWTISTGTTAREAAGVIHTDFKQKMISARVANWQDFVKLGGWKGLKEAGKIRTEGRDYLMQKDDLVEFLIGS